MIYKLQKLDAQYVCCRPLLNGNKRLIICFKLSTGFWYKNGRKHDNATNIIHYILIIYILEIQINPSIIILIDDWAILILPKPQ